MGCEPVPKIKAPAFGPLTGVRVIPGEKTGKVPELFNRYHLHIFRERDDVGLPVRPAGCIVTLLRSGRIKFPDSGRVEVRSIHRYRSIREQCVKNSKASLNQLR